MTAEQSVGFETAGDNPWAASGPLAFGLASCPAAGGAPWKRPLDVLLAAIGLILAAPIIIVAATLVSLDGGPPFYAQCRLGLDGRRFTLFKLRTMCVASEAALDEILRCDPRAREEFGRSGKIARDARVSRVGRWLRRHSLDELPQLLNVLIGDMSIVGPRPRTLRWLSLAASGTPQFQAYFAIRPGITGTWQVSDRPHRNDATRMLLDADYVENISPWGDVGIMARTIPLLFSGR